MTRPLSFVAERAVRLLRERGGPLASVDLAREVLATDAPDEESATTVLRAAFAGDARLRYETSGWSVEGAVEPAPPPTSEPAGDEPDRTVIHLGGHRDPASRAYVLDEVSVLRIRRDDVLSACGGTASEGADARRLRRAVLETIEGAVPVIHDPPGALPAFESWLGEALPAPISLRRLAQERLGLGAAHEVGELASRLGLHWRETDDPLERAGLLDACLQELRAEDESLHDLRLAQLPGAHPIDWSRFAFDREFVRQVPPVPGTYRFFDAAGNLLYVGKSRNLRQRVGSYFREDRARQNARVTRLLERLHRLEYEPSGSDLEAVLREAAAIRRDEPETNVQREVSPRHGRAARLRSILVLEPAEAPFVLRAYLIRDGRLLDRVALGPRGGGLRRIARLLEDHYFSAPYGPTPAAGPDLDVELVVRWLAAHRDRVVAFDPTDLGTAEEVLERLRWFLRRGSPFDADGSPIHER